MLVTTDQPILYHPIKTIDTQMDQQRPLPSIEDISHTDGQALGSPGYTESSPSWPGSKLGNEPTGACTVHGKLYKAKRKRKPFGISCVACYQRKKKCLGGKPCNNCRARGEDCERRRLEGSSSSVGITEQSDRANEGVYDQPNAEATIFQDQSPTTGIQVQQPSEYIPAMATTHSMEAQCIESTTGNQGLGQSLPIILGNGTWQTPDAQPYGPPWQAVTGNGSFNFEGQGGEDPPQQGEYMAASGLSQLMLTPYAQDRQPVVYSSIGLPHENLVETTRIRASTTSIMPVYESPSKDVLGSSNHQDFDEGSFSTPTREPWTLPGFLTLDQVLIYRQQNVDPTACPYTAMRHPTSMWEPQSFGGPRVSSGKACDTFQGLGFRSTLSPSYGVQNEEQYDYPHSTEPNETYPHYKGYSSEKHHNIKNWLSCTEQEASQP